jgi:hypothetical protein
LEQLHGGARLWLVEPHIVGGMTAVQGSRMLPDGSSLSVAVITSAHDGSSYVDDGVAVIIVNVPLVLETKLRASEVLLSRMLGLFKDEIGFDERVYVTAEVLENTQNCERLMSQVIDGGGGSSSSSVWLPFEDTKLLEFSPRETRISRGNTATINLPAGKCARFSFNSRNEKSDPRFGTFIRTHPNPFPPPCYAAYFLGADLTTTGNWIGTYGASGYFLAAYDGSDRHLSQVALFGCVVRPFSLCFTLSVVSRLGC